ncbi:MAG: ATP-binding protein [Verrucomicrobiota bacterium]
MLATHSKAIIDRFIPQIGVTPVKELMGALFAEVADLFQVERIGYSRMEDDRSAIQQEVQYYLSENRCDTGALPKLHAKDYPGYFKALETPPGVVISDDVMTDERLAEFWLGYFTPLNIMSMLDVPVIRAGRLFGVICHEHVGPMRKWTDEEVAAACGFGHLVALAVETDLRQRLERELLESRARYQRVIEHTPVATVIVDLTSGKFIDANASACRLYGWDRETLLQGGPADFSPERQPDGRLSEEAAREKIGQALEGEEPRFEWTHLGAGGREIPCLVHLGCMPGSEASHVIATVTDRTEQIRTEETIRRALENEREVNELRSRFTAIVSHEFRTPLGIIMSAVDLLRNYFDRIGESKREELLTDIRQAVWRMGGLMEQVLVLGRADSGNLGFSPVSLDLEGLCAKLADEANSVMAGRCPIRTDFAPDLEQVVADEGLLRHVFSNLLSNAAKYSEAGSPIDFTAARDGADAVFSVRDRGIGIPLEDQPRMFEAFQRAGNVGETPGTGLGLLIVKRCLELHGGTISFESIPRDGTTFTVRMPLFA